MTNHQHGRANMARWQEKLPKNFFLSNQNLQNVLRYYMGEPAYNHAQARLSALGAHAATTLDELAKQEDRIGNHPKLERYDGIGRRTEAIEFHPNHDHAGRIIWGSGIMALQADAGNTTLQMGLYYLLCHNGEAGHLCSMACTSGLIRALQQEADAPLRAKFLPPLLVPDYDTMQHGAQFLTEVQGGSDVGANSVQASQQPDGTWRIHGEKWFCSNVNAQQFLMTARATAHDGTKGLGLFLVPRTLDDGTPNAFFIRRLKDKLGTRTLASAELDFEGATAYAVGAVENGFKIAVELVLNTSRLMNAVACAGIMRRAYYEAGYYACTREAFGASIISYPMVQEAIAELDTEAHAATASCFYLAHLLDRIETGQASAHEEALYRLLVNVNKYLTSVRGSQMVHRAIEVLGGNGAIESFSILPRLYRDMVVLESWEGTHNVLALQVLRDVHKLRLDKAFLAQARAWLESATHAELAPHRARLQEALADFTAWLGKLKSLPSGAQAAHARRLLDRLGTLTQALLLLSEAHAERTHGAPSRKLDILAHFIALHHTPAYDPMQDNEHLARIERLTHAL